MFFRIVIFYLLGAHAQLFANEPFDDSSRLPKVISHSETLVRMEMGQVVELSLAAKSVDKIVWLTRKREICFGFECRIDSRDMGLGRHVIAAIALNQHGSKTVIFTIQVITNKDANPSQQIIKPEQIQETALLTNNLSYDAFVVAKKGWGLSYLVDYQSPSRSEINIVKEEPRVIKWMERLKTKEHPLKFGYHGQEEFYLLSNSQAQLLRVNGEQKIVVMLNGDLRYRDLSSRGHLTTVMLQDWGQIDFSPYSDVIIQLSKDARSAKVQVLQGHALIHKKHPYHSEDVFGELSEMERTFEKNILALNQKNNLQIPAARSVLLSKNSSAEFEASPLDHRTVYQTIVQTTPELVMSEKIDFDQSPSQPSYLSVKSRLGEILANQSQTELKSNLQQGFYVSIIEALLMKKKLGQLTFDEKMVLASASEALFAGSKVPFDLWYDLAKTEPESEGEANFRAGLYLANFGLIDKSQKLLEKSRDRGYDSDGLGDYYLGQIYFKKGRCSKAYVYLKNAQKSYQFREIKESALQWSRIAKKCIDWSLGLQLGYLYTDNLFRIGKSSQLRSRDQDGSKLPNAGSGYSARFRGQKWFFHDSFVSPYVSFVANRHGWFSEELHFYDYIFQNLSLGLQLGRENNLSFYATAQTHIYGNDRLLDGVGGGFSINLTSFLSRPYLSSEILIFRDPSLDIVKIIDPITNDYLNSASDLSSRLTSAHMGLFVVDSALWQVKMGLGIHSRTFANQIAAISNHRSNKIFIDQLFPSVLGTQWKLDLSYEQMDFQDVNPSMSEKRWQMQFSSRINWGDYFVLQPRYKLHKQLSDRVNRSFDLQTYSLAILFDW